MSIPSPKRSSRRSNGDAGRVSGWGPNPARGDRDTRPGRVLAVWGVVVVVSLGLTGTLLGTGLTSESSLTNHPESDQAQKLIDARLPGQDTRSTRSSSCAPNASSRPTRRSRRACGRWSARAARSGAVEADLQLPGPGRRDPGLGRPPRHGAAGRRSTEPKDERILGSDLDRRARQRERRLRGAHHGQLHARSRLHRAVRERPAARASCSSGFRPRSWCCCWWSARCSASRSRC